MIRSIFTFAFFLFFIQVALSQDNKQCMTYTQGQSFDTAIKPDYYVIELTLTEFRTYDDNNKNRKYFQVTLDSIQRNLFSLLENYVSEKEIRISSLINREYNITSHGFPEDNKKATFKFILSSIESIKSVFNIISDNIPFEAIKTFEVKPKINKNTFESMQKVMEKIAYEKVLKDVKEYAEFHKVNIQRVDNYEVEFREKMSNDYYFSQMKVYNVSFIEPVYTLIVKHTFSLK
jgi:hypothetical protein